MKRTIDFLEEVKALHSLTSDYQLAKFLGVTRSCVSKLQSGRDYLGEETAIKVSKALKIDAGYVIACSHVERAKNEEIRATWRSVVEKLGSVAATVIIGIAAYTLPVLPAHAVSSLLPNNVYYVKSRRRNAKRTLLDQIRNF